MRITCDLDEEKAKALAHDGSVLVTANPGTGKTHLLIRLAEKSVGFSRRMNQL